MNRRRAIYLVARREVIERGRSRAFILALILTVVLLLLATVLPALVAGVGRASRLGIVGTPPATFAPTLTAAASLAGSAIQVEPVPNEATGEERLRDGTLDALFIVPVGTGRATYVVKQQRTGFLSQIVSSTWSAIQFQDLLTQSGITAGDLTTAAAPPTVRELQPSDPNRETAFLFANVGIVLLFISIFTFGTWVLTGVVEEKQSRVVEVVLSTLEARDLLIGKVLGIGLLGLVQLSVLVAVGLGTALAVGRVTLPPTTPATIAMLFLWFGLGYVLYSTALACLGALASRMEEASNASSPITFVAMGAYVFSLLVALNDPDGLAARIGSLIPPVAPMVVPLRTALGAIEPWEIVLSAAITVVTIVALFVLGGRVYAGAVLRTGGRIRFRDALGAARR
jgi:ABC-2 type transport system permease protein